MIDYKITGKQLADALDRVEISRRGAARHLFDLGERTVRRMIAEEPGTTVPNAITIALALMIKHKHTAEEIEEIVRAIFPPPRRKAKATR